MFVDSYDMEHIWVTFNKEAPRLVDKLIFLKQEVGKKIKRIPVHKRTLYTHPWKNPDTKTKWIIYYSIAREKSVTEAQYYPVTEIVNRNAKDYLMIVDSIVGKKLKVQEYVIKLFKAHFISRFR